ncbi:MAG: choice-of-anchor D domain-containing protein [Pseudomonadota bacterium]|nr:choice-of-anchor D domain-containing protein [Pseudomonadota bacterium]
MLFLVGLSGCIDFELEGVKPDEDEGLRDLVVDPGVIDFGILASNAPITQTVTLTSVGDEPVTVSTIDLSGSTAFMLTWASAELTLQPGESADVIVTYTPASFDDEGQIVVRSDAVEPNQAVDLRGAGTYPGILVTPGSLYFESEYGESVDHEVVVSSIGTSDLDLSELFVQGAQFSAVSGIPDVLPPGETTTISVTYTPEVEGETASGKLWITTNTALGYAIVPLEARQIPPCMGLGEAWDRGLLAGNTEIDGGTFRVENYSADEDVCIDNWYVWIAEESQDLGAGDMDADFGDVYPTGSLTIAPEDYQQFDAGRPAGATWWCMELTQNTQPSKSYVFTGARVPEPLLTYMLAGDQDAVWAWQDLNPVLIAGRTTNFVAMPGGGGSAPVTLRITNMGSMDGTAEVRETIPADYTATGFSQAPVRTEAGEDGATVYVFEVWLDERTITGQYEQTGYDIAEITYTLGVPACTGRQYLEPMQTRWVDSDGTDRVGTANPLVVNCK